MLKYSSQLNILKKMTKKYTNPIHPPLNCKPKLRQDWSRLYGSSVKKKANSA